ncbi:hypothetical protein BJ138DRAFT_1183541 [Hygrophoropsis aurantiaca]|uniref:Uncharacterized protein n=1 Tax=Hygrophoropsis aurantiaca TaxID=72124 RepID=A0ACB7ZWW9_9AGAM|nr:hypothetical protein BJ138DRAFT_1183541 [Hygrophoropsis aurantiaca]
MADPAVIQVLQTIQTTNYITAAGAALVVYDQVLTLSQEVDLIWNRNWSFMTVLYLIARYSGNLSMVGLAVWDMCISWTSSVDVNITLAVNWGENIFLLTMQAILVIRVYALFNRSRKVLIFLATLYVLQATTTFVMTSLYYNNRVQDEIVASTGPAIGSVMQIINTTTAFLHLSVLAGQDGTIMSVVFDIVVFFFALWAFVQHTLEARTLDGGWSINVLVRTLIADHLAFFVCNLIWLSLALASVYYTEFSVFTASLTGTLNVFTGLVVVSGPRMVISLRAMENKTRGEGGTLEGEVSTIRFGVREPPTQSESVMEEGVGFRAADENTRMD